MSEGDFRNCYNRKQGGVFTFINTTVKDYYTKFQMNQALDGGVIYCDDCSLQFQQTIFNFLFALRGGAINLNGTSSASFLDTEMENLYSYDKGKNKIREVHSKIMGGAFYIDQQSLEISIDSIYQYSSSALQSGGFMYLENAKSLKISNSNFERYQGHNGAFIQSVARNITIDIESSSFSQNSVIIQEDPRDTYEPVDFSNDIYGALYIRQAEYVSFKNNQFFKHYFKYYGSVAFLEHTKFKDDGSSYLNSLSQIGGVMYFNQTYIVEMNNIFFEENIGLTGAAGLHFEQVQGDLTMTNVTFIKSRGIIGAIYYQHLDDLESTKSDQFIICNVSINNSIAANYGGLFYSDPNGIFISKGLIMYNVDTAYTGLIVIQSARMVEFHNSYLEEIRGQVGDNFVSIDNLKESAYISQTVIQNDPLVISIGLRRELEIWNFYYFQYSTDQFNPYSLITIRGRQAFINNLYIRRGRFDDKQRQLIRVFGIDGVQPILFLETNSYYEIMDFPWIGQYLTSNAKVFQQNIIYNDYRIEASLFNFEKTILFMKNVTFSGFYGEYRYRGIFERTQDSFGTYNTLDLHNITFHGFFVYSSGTILQLNRHIDSVKFTNCTFSSFFCVSRGGLAFATQDENKVSTIEFQSSFLSDIKSFEEGYLIYSTSPNIYFKIIDTIIECQSDMAQSEISDYQGIGVIYLKNSIEIGIFSQRSIFRHCSIPEAGSFFNLIQAKFQDDSSIFLQNKASRGGSIMCSECELDLKNTTFLNNQANQGAGIFADKTVKIKLDQVNILDNYAKGDGGFIYMRFNEPDTQVKSIVEIKNSKMITGNSAQNGGFLYSSNPLMELYISGIEIQDSKSSIRGGFINILKGSKVQILNSKFYDFKSPEGAFIYSSLGSITFNIQNSIFQCSKNELLTNKTYQLINNDFILETDSQFSISNADLVISKNNIYQYCGTTSQGGIFRLQKTKFTDYKSKYQYNSALIGGVIQSQESQVEISNSKFYSNEAKLGGVLHIVQNSNLSIKSCEFSKNFALTSSGAIYLQSQSLLYIQDSEFTLNYAADNSVMEIQTKTEIDQPIIIRNSNFENNFSQRTLISMMYANVLIQDSTFKNNGAMSRTKGLLCGSLNITLIRCFFQNDYSDSWKIQLKDERTTGSFIFLVSQTIMTVKNSRFVNGFANMGGAIFISDNSQLEIQESNFLNNKAKTKGGAIYTSGFQSIWIGNFSNFKDNYALDQGDDIYITNSMNMITLNQVDINNINAKNSIYIEQAKLQSNQLVIRDIYSNKDSKNGGAINCQYCTGLDIKNSRFINIRSSEGGAIFIIDSDLTKSTNYQKYRINNSTFQNCTAEIGGAIYISNPESMIILNSQFIQNQAIQITDLTNQVLNYGQGGAIYYTCNYYQLDCFLKFEGINVFKQNKASIQGGGIYWDILEPQFNQNNFWFIENYANQYGDDIACFAQNLISISQQTYLNQMEKVGGSIGSENYQRDLQISVDEVPKNQGIKVVENQRSGGPLPIIYMSLIDKYGQIVGSDFSSSVRVQVNTTNLDSDAAKYPPLVEGTSDFTVNSGIAVLREIYITGNPGSSYKVIFSTDGIDLTKLSNKQLLEQKNSSELNFQLNLQLRECILGEQFTQLGKCQLCTESYSLVQMQAPGDCISCPIDRAICTGGTTIGPLPGFWRGSNISQKFEKCLYLPACLGMVSPNLNPIGECLVGHQGILCADCAKGYSRDNKYFCSQCPNPALNFIRLFAISLGVIIFVILIIRSTLNTSKDPYLNTSIYLKILLNHLQLLSVTASLPFQWSEQILNFFSSTKDIATAQNQIFSIDCFLQIDKNDSSQLRIFYTKLLIIALLPFLLSYICFQFWLVYNSIKKKGCLVDGKFTSTLVILLFLAHPSIVQYSFFNFKCVDVDSQMRVYDDLEIICWDNTHRIYSYLVALPSIIVWGMGIPFLALSILMKYQNRLKNLAVREKYGFLYRGYKYQFYYWEIIIMYRKILITFVAVFVESNFGVVAQALIMLMILVWFLAINYQFKPFNTKALNELETVSLITSMATIYCGIFFILDKSKSWIEKNADYANGAILLPDAIQKLFFFLVVIANLLFFVLWISKMYKELKSRFRFQNQRLYLILCLCNNNEKLEQEKIKYSYYLQNLRYSEELEKCIDKYQNFFVKNKIQLNDKIIQKLGLFLNEENILKYFGKKSNKDQNRGRFQRKLLFQSQSNNQNQGSQAIDEDQQKSYFGSQKQALGSDSKNIKKQFIIEPAHHDSQLQQTQQSINSEQDFDFMSQQYKEANDMNTTKSIEINSFASFQQKPSFERQRNKSTFSSYIKNVENSKQTKIEKDLKNMTQLENLVNQFKQKDIVVQKTQYYKRQKDGVKLSKSKFRKTAQIQSEASYISMESYSKQDKNQVNLYNKLNTKGQINLARKKHQKGQSSNQIDIVLNYADLGEFQQSPNFNEQKNQEQINGNPEAFSKHVLFSSKYDQLLEQYTSQQTNQCTSKQNVNHAQKQNSDSLKENQNNTFENILKIEASKSKQQQTDGLQDRNLISSQSIDISENDAIDYFQSNNQQKSNEVLNVETIQSIQESNAFDF
ncbi:UNKNOWN [Stylonychia lemnae]|uniref:Transmembrane protein n=1 Tax=Stylonychia lemnae TaxID=5949 RepID=A0A078BAJ1_STYLE|nr:UNKNOWN [Stylonychia lemnae]|eukprot:CDW91246.1 UNKNOWN [Stylonychia lemnae]